MGQPRLSLRNRLILFQAEYREAVIGVGFFCAIGVAMIVPIAMSRNNPIVGTQIMTGVVENVSLMPLNPKSAVGRGLYYRYGIRLHDSNALVFVDGEVETPHIVGSDVPIERQHHKYGADSFRLIRA
ncbi:hypothetical protein [Mesorhizobium sp. M0587]|uniref:hypothetical protein n=1 Tax=Mesorhizobium sp. M0587 TaxID=2956964 RepID=UPI003338DF04